MSPSAKDYYNAKLHMCKIYTILFSKCSFKSAVNYLTLKHPFNLYDALDNAGCALLSHPGHILSLSLTAVTQREMLAMTTYSHSAR